MKKKFTKKLKINNDLSTMAISNGLFSPSSDTSTKCELAKQNPLGFSVWCVPPDADKC